MSYVADLGTGQKLYLENRDTQTIIALMSSNLGQQQSQQVSVALGKWSALPTLFRTPNSIILRVESDQGRSFVGLQLIGQQASSIRVLNEIPSLDHADVLPLQQMEDSAEPSMRPMQPMQPMQPMKMGNMEMRMEPMEMRMGDMQLRMETPTQSKTRFCSQCGTKVKESDSHGEPRRARFCSNCGHKLHD